MRDTVIAPASALATRLVELLKYLARTQADWSVFADAERVRWDKLILVGHSQGAGHAAYLASASAWRRC